MEAQNRKFGLHMTRAEIQNEVSLTMALWYPQVFATCRWGIFIL